MAATFPGGASTDNIQLSINTRPASRSIAFKYYRVSDGGGSAGRIFAQSSDFITTNNSGKIQFNADWSTDGIWITDAVHLTATTWVDVVISYDGSSTSNDPVFYINGASVAITETTAPVGTRNTGAATLYVGNNSALNRALDGNLAEFAMYDRALSAAEALEIHQGSPLNVPDFVVYLPLVRDIIDYANAAPTVSGTTVAVHPRVVYTTSTFSTGYTPVVVPPDPDPTSYFKYYVDWDGDGNFTETEDEITEDVMRADWRVGFRKPFAEMADENTATLELKNSTGKYNPENVSSPLYGLLLPHRRMQIVADDGVSPVVMWTGWIEFPQIEWRPAAAYTGKTTATLLGVGAKSYLDDLEVVTPYYTDETGDVIIEDLLADSGLTTVSTDFSQIETGLTVLDYFGDNKSGRTLAYRVIEEITKAERGRFFIDRQGRPVWWNRHHLIRTSTVTATVSDTTGDYKPVQADYSYGAFLANIIRIESNPRKLDPTETLWNLDTDPLTIRRGEVQTFEVKLRRESGQFAAAASLGYTATYSQGTTTITVTERGGAAIIELDNTAGTVDAVLTAFVLEGEPIVDQNKFIIELQDTTSVTTYGKRGYGLDMGPIASYPNALSVAQYELSRRKNPTGNVGRISYIRRADGVSNAHMVDWEIGNLIDVNFSNTVEHSAGYFIIGEEHRWTPGKDGGQHETTFYLEYANAAGINFWLLGVAGYSELGETTYVGY